MKKYSLTIQTGELSAKDVVSAVRAINPYSECQAHEGNVVVETETFDQLRQEVSLIALKMIRLKGL